MVSPATSAGKRRGFTLIEILIVLGIFAILAVSSFPLYSNMQIQSSRQSALEDVADSLRLSIAQFRQDQNARGVLFEPHAVIIFKGDTYATRVSANDQRINFDETIILTTTFLTNEFNTKNSNVSFPVGSVIVEDTITKKRAIVRVTSLGVIVYDEE